MSKPISIDALITEHIRQSARLMFTQDPILKTSVRDLAELIVTYGKTPQSLIFAADQRPKYGPGG